jgi:hypothetical protein
MFLRCGNQFCQLTIPVRALPFWHGFLTQESSSIGIRITSSQTNWGAQLSLTQVNLSRNAAVAKAFSGMKSPSTVAMHAGTANFRVQRS